MQRINDIARAVSDIQSASKSIAGLTSDETSSTFKVLIARAPEALRSIFDAFEYTMRSMEKASITPVSPNAGGSLWDVAKSTIESLLSENEFLGYQLAHAQGGLDDTDFEKIADEYLGAYNHVEPDLPEKAMLLAMLLPNRFDATLVATAFRCDIGQAERAIQLATVNIDTIIAPHLRNAGARR